MRSISPCINADMDSPVLWCSNRILFNRLLRSSLPGRQPPDCRFFLRCLWFLFPESSSHSIAELHQETPQSHLKRGYFSRDHALYLGFSYEVFPPLLRGHEIMPAYHGILPTTFVTVLPQRLNRLADPFNLGATSTHDDRFVNESCTPVWDCLYNNVPLGYSSSPRIGGSHGVFHEGVVWKQAVGARSQNLPMVVGLKQANILRPLDSLAAAVNLQLSIDVLYMRAHCAHGKGQFFCDLGAR